MNKNKSNQNYDTVQFEIAIYMVLHESSNNTASFTEHLKFQEKNDFYRSILGE